jgi:hypothetical protein
MPRQNLGSSIRSSGNPIISTAAITAISTRLP